MFFATKKKTKLNLEKIVFVIEFCASKFLFHRCRFNIAIIIIKKGVIRINKINRRFTYIIYYILHIQIHIYILIHSHNKKKFLQLSLQHTLTLHHKET